jgi:hypothetical protein
MKRIAMWVAPATLGVAALMWIWTQDRMQGTLASEAQGAVEARAGAVQVTPAGIDFGRVRVDEPVEEMLVVTNVGDGTLELLVAIDAPFRASRHELKLEPRESREVLVGLRQAEPGSYAGALRLARAEAAEPDLAVPLAAVVHLPGRAQVSPLSLRFGSVEIGQAVQSELEIRNDGEDVLRITGLGVVSPFALPDQASDELELAPGTRHFVTVEFRPTLAGEHRRQLVLRTNDPDEPQFQVGLSGEGIDGKLYPRAELSREALDFGEVMVGRVRELSLQVRNAGSDPLRLTRVAVPAPFSVVQRSREIPPGRAFLLPVSYAPIAYGSSREQLRVFTNDPERSVLEATLLGVGSAAGGGRAVGGPRTGGGTLLDEDGRLPDESPLLDPTFDPPPLEDGLVAIGTYDAQIGPEHAGDVIFDPAARELRIDALQLPEVVTAGDQRFSFDPVDVRLSVDANGEVQGQFSVTVANSLGNREAVQVDLTSGEMVVHTPSGSLAVQGKPLGSDGKATLVGQVPGGYMHRNVEIVLHVTAQGVKR